MDNAIFLAKLSGSWKYILSMIESISKAIEAAQEHVPRIYCPVEFIWFIKSSQGKLDGILAAHPELPENIQKRILASKESWEQAAELSVSKMAKILHEKEIKSVKDQYQNLREKIKCPGCTSHHCIPYIFKTECEHIFCIYCIWKYSMVDKKCLFCSKEVKAEPHFESTQIFREFVRPNSI